MIIMFQKVCITLVSSGNTKIISSDEGMIFRENQRRKKVIQSIFSPKITFLKI